MKHTWTLVILIFLGTYEAELLCQIATEGPSKYVTFANQELDNARKACGAGSFADAKAGFEVAIDFLAKGKAEYQDLQGEESSVKKMDELIAAAENELEDCLKRERDTSRSSDDQNFAYNPELWDQIDLTSPASKRRQHNVFPWWWAAGPVAIVTGTVIILAQDEEDDTPPPPVAANIGLVINCGAGGSINPTVNDIGRNINITDFDNSSGWVTLQRNTLIISTEAVESFSIAYTITDELGRTSSAAVEVTVTNGNPVVPATITLEIEQGESGLVQVFDFFECDGCSLLRVDPNDAFLTVSSNPTGEINFQVNPEFEGMFSTAYHIVDRCQREISGTLTIIVGAEPCEIDGEPFVTDATCGLNDGVIVFATEELFGNYNFLIDGELTSDTIRQLAPGTYQLRVEVAENTDCFETYELTVNQGDFDILDDVATTPGNCFTSGGALLSVLSDQLSAYYPEPGLEMELTGEGFNFQTALPQSPLVDLVQIIEMETGVQPVLGEVTVRIFAENAPDECVQSLSFVIEEEEVDLMVVEDNYNTEAGIPIMENVLLNDIGTGLTVLNHTTSPDGQVTVQENGSSQFIPNPGFTGSTSFMYTVLDICGRTAQGLVTITVTPADCTISGNLTSTAASCGKSDGSATANIQISGVASPTWDLPPGWVQEGDFIFVNNNLPAGNLTVVITEISSGCSVELNTTIEEEDADYILNISSMPANCVTSGDILVDIMDMPAQFLICLLDESQNIIGEWPANPGQNALSQFTDIPAGNYMVVVKVEGFPDHCQSSGNITVDETTIPLMLNDDTATINQGESWTGNVLNNDMGTGLTVIAFTQAPNGETTVNSDGNSTFTPNLNFSGVTSFTYTVEDVCGQMGIAMVTITVNPADCTFTGGITVTPATCGQEDGSANFNITNWPAACDDGNACDLSISWSNGATTNPNTNLPAGNYSATVTLTPLGCSDVFNFTIASKPIEYYTSITTTPGNCIDGGNIEISFNNQSAIAPSVSITVIWEGDQVLQTSAPWGAFDLSDFITVFPGNYEIFLLATGLSQECSESVTLEVPEVGLPLELPDQMYSIAFGESWTGNVLDNAVGTSLVVSDFTTPPQATLTINLEGDAVLVPNNGFSGVLVFEFTATDICGQMSTATVTVMVGDPGCFFIQTVSIIPGNCNTGNEAVASLNNPDALTLTITLTNPMGEFFMTMTNGSSIELSSLTELTGGLYLLEVSHGTCTDQLNFELDNIDVPSLDLLEANPPSSPDAFDGSILLNLSGGSGPYIILVNGDANGPFPGGLVNLPDLPQGVYELTALDGNECPSETLEVSLFAGLLASDDHPPSILANNYSAWSPLSISQIAVSDHWVPGLLIPEHTELPRDIRVSHSHQVEVGGSFGKDWRFPIRISVGQVAGHIQANHPMSGIPLIGQWRSHYAGIAIAPQWKLGGLKGNIQLGGILGHLSGYLAGEAVDFDLQMLTRAFRLTPTLQIPVSPQMHMEVGYDLLMNLATQGNRVNSVPNITFSATF